MSEGAYYPTLDLQTLKGLKIVLQLSSEDSSYFLDTPWSGEIQLLVEELTKPKKIVHQAAPVEKKEGEEEWEFLARETRGLYDGLKVAGIGLEGNELMAFYKTSTSLLEKLLAMQERANNLKHVSDFYQLVLDVMEDSLTGDQRTTVMQKLKDSIK